jgi:hypothetical protein
MRTHQLLFRFFIDPRLFDYRRYPRCGEDDDLTYGRDRGIGPVGWSTALLPRGWGKPLLRVNANWRPEQARDGGNAKMARAGHTRNGTVRV